MNDACEFIGMNDACEFIGMNDACELIAQISIIHTFAQTYTQMLPEALQPAAPEIWPYLTASIGDKTRIDYGTGLYVCKYIYIYIYK